MDCIVSRNRGGMKKLKFKRNGFIINSIALFSLTGKLLFEKEFAVFVSKGFFELELPEILRNRDALLTVSTSFGQFSKVINNSVETILL